MTRRLLLTLVTLNIGLLLNSSGSVAQNPSLIYRHSLFSFSYERGQILLIPAEGASSLIKETRMEIYNFSGGKVFDSGAVANQPIVWRLQDQTGAAAPDGKYICSIQFKLDDGKSDVVFGQLTKSAQGVRFSDAPRMYKGSPANGAKDFFKRLASLRPDDASAWLWYGKTMFKPLESSFEPLGAPPPPPPPPVSRKKNAGRQQKQRDVTFVRSAGHNPSESDLIDAINAFKRAFDMATDCATKDQALTRLASAYDQLGAEAEVTELLLKRAESECATNEVKASSYYSLGVKHWMCAYDLSTAYADRNNSEPFHYRAFTNLADRRKFDNCLTKGFEFIEKALALDPEYVEAIFYKGLLCREKQKASEDSTERGRWAEEAIKLADKGTDIQKRKERK
jgi:tetratricopeptide (TPR) repeat protein